MKSTQTTLFENTKAELPANFDALAKGDPGIAFHVAIGQGLTKGLAIWKVIESNFETDWLKLWECFERNGFSEYCDINIGCQDFTNGS